MSQLTYIRWPCYPGCDMAHLHDIYPGTQYHCFVCSDVYIVQLRYGVDYRTVFASLYIPDINNNSFTYNHFQSINDNIMFCSIHFYVSKNGL